MASSVWKFGHSLDRVVAGVREGLSQLDGCELTAVSRTEARVRISATFTNDAGRVDDVSLDVEEKEGQTFITLFSKTRGKGEKSFYDQNRRNLYRVYAALPFTPVSSVPALPVTIPQEYELLVIAMLDPKSGVTLKDRKWMILKKYPHTFLGSEMVDWLMQHKNISREESVELASKLYKLGLFTYAEGKNKPFRDGKFYYRFMIGDDANWEELENLEQRMQAIERKATDEYNRLLFNAPHVPDPSAASQPSVIVPSSPRSAISSNQRSPSPPLGRRSSYPGKKEKQTKKKTANDLSSSEESDSHVSERRNSSSSKEVGANLGISSGESGSKQQKLLSLTKFTRKRDLTSSGVEYMQPPSVDGSPLTLQRKHLSDLKRDEKKKKGGLWASRNRIMTRKKSKKEKEKEKKLGSRASSASSGVVYVPAGEGKGLLVVGADHASEEVVWDDDPLTARKRLIKEEQKRIEMLKNMKKFWEMKLYGEVIGRKKAESIERTLQRSNTTLEEDSGLDGGKEASAPTGEEEEREAQPTDKKRDKTGPTKHKRIRSKSKKDEKKSKPLSGSKTAEDKDQADTVCEVKKRARNLTIGSPTGSSSSFKKMLEDVSGSWSNDDGTTSWIKEQFENRRKAGGSVVLQTPDSTQITKTETEVLSSSAAPSSSASSSSTSSSSSSSSTVAPIKDPPPAIILPSEDVDGSAPTRVRFDTASQKMAEKRWQDYLAAQDLKRSRATIQGFELLKGVKKLPVDKFTGEKGDSIVDESADYDDDDDVLNVSIEEILYDCEQRKEVLEKAKELIQTNYELRLKIQENHLQSQMLFNHLNTSGATATATATAIEKKSQKTEEMESQSPSSSSKESDETYKLLDQSDFDGDVASALASYGGSDSAILRLSEDSPQREENEEEEEEDDSDDEEEESSSSYYDEDEDDDDDDDEEDSGDSSDEEVLPSATEYLLTSDSIIMRSEMTRQQSYASPSFIQPPSEIVRPVDKSSTKQNETSTSTQQQQQNDEERKVNFLPKVLTEGEFAYCRNIDFTDVVLLEPPVGYGAFGVVYRGIWRGAIVAVKKLLVVLDNKQFLQFLREAEIMEHVSNHPNVAHFCGVTSTKPHYCIVGEFYEHGSMVDYLRNNPNAPLNVVVSMARDAAAGVLHLHKEDIIHRDLAARNLLVCSNLHVHVSDFGLARTKQRVNAQTNGNLGAVKWMAPEAITHRHFSEKSDSWSFGVVLWEMVTGGKEPYQDKEILDVALGVSSGALRLEIPEECPKPLRRLIKKCLQHDPQQRPSFEEIWGQLDEFLRFLEGTTNSSSS